MLRGVYKLRKKWLKYEKFKRRILSPRFSSKDVIVERVHPSNQMII